MGRKRKDGTPTPINPVHYAMALETRQQITAEMGRCYRAVRNKKLDISDLGPLIFTLKTMREGLPETTEATGTSHFIIQPVAEGCFVRDMSVSGRPLVIEHAPPPEHHDESAANEQLLELSASIEALARRVGVDR